MRYLFLVLIAISYQLSAQNSFFDNFYPLNSDYRDVAISENNVLIGGTNGALLHSADYGENWKRIYVEGNYTINTVQILDNVFISAGSNGGFYVSYDEGKTWQSHFLEGRNNIKNSFIYNEKVYLIVDDDKIIVTEDFGKSFEHIYPESRVGKIANFHIKDEKIYIAYDHGEFIELALNGSILNKYNLHTEATIIDFCLDNNNNFYILSNLWVSKFIIETGDYNILFDNEELIMFGNSPLQLSYVDNILLYFVKSNARYIDILEYNGESFDYREDYIPSDVLFGVESRKAAVYNDIIVIVGDLNTIFTSQDFGKSMIAKSYYTDYINFWRIFELFSEHQFYTASIRGRVFSTFDNGATFLPSPFIIRFPNGYRDYKNVTGIVMLDSLFGYATMQSNQYIAQTTDGGKTYTNTDLNISQESSFELYDRRNFLAHVHLRQLGEYPPRNVLSIMRDSSWFSYQVLNELFDCPGSQIVREIKYLNKDSLLVLGTCSDSVYVMPNGFELNINKVFLGILYDNATKFEFIDFGDIAFSDGSLSIVNEKTWFLRGYDRYYNEEISSFEHHLWLLKTEDAGENWNLIYKEYNEYANPLLIISEEQLIFKESKSNTLRESKDGGQTWNIYPLPLGAEITEMAYKDGTFLIGGRRTFLKNKTNDLTVVSVKDKTESLINSDNIPSIWQYPPYPNPARDYTYIKFVWDKRMPHTGISVVIYDIYGNTIARMNHEHILFENENIGAVRWNTLNVPTGVYLATVRLNNTVRSHKITVVR